MHVALRTLIVGSVLLLGGTDQVRADEVADEKIREALQITMDAAERYDFNLKAPGQPKLKLHPKSVLRWSNPIAGEEY